MRASRPANCSPRKICSPMSSTPPGGNVVEVEDPDIGPFPMQNVVPRLSETPGEVRWTGPKLGQHNDEIYSQVLGMGEEDLDSHAGAGHHLMRIEIVDVGPRDGLQNEDETLAPGVRAELCDRLAATGIPRWPPRWPPRRTRSAGWTSCCSTRGSPRASPGPRTSTWPATGGSSGERRSRGVRADRGGAGAAPGRGGHVATASLAGLVPMPGDALYTLTKHAVVGYVRAAAPTLAAEGIGSTRSVRGSPTRP